MQYPPVCILIDEGGTFHFILYPSVQTNRMLMIFFLKQIYLRISRRMYLLQHLQACHHLYQVYFHLRNLRRYHQTCHLTLQCSVLVMAFHAQITESAKEMGFANAKTLLSRSKMEKIVLAQMEHSSMHPRIVVMHQLLPQLYLLCLHL